MSVHADAANDAFPLAYLYVERGFACMPGTCQCCHPGACPDSDASDDGLGGVHMVRVDGWLRRRQENSCEFCGNEPGKEESMNHLGCHEYGRYPSCQLRGRPAHHNAFPPDCRRIRKELQAKVCQGLEERRACHGARGLQQIPARVRVRDQGVHRLTAGTVQN